MGKEIDPSELAHHPEAQLVGLRTMSQELGALHGLQRRNLARVTAAVCPENARFTLRVDLDDPKRNLEQPGLGRVVHLHYVSEDVISDEMLQFFRRYVRWLLGDDWRVTLSHATIV